MKKILVIGSGPIIIGQAAEFEDQPNGLRRYGELDGGRVSAVGVVEFSIEACARASGTYIFLPRAQKT